MSTDAAPPNYVLPVLGFRVWRVDDDGRLWPRTSKAAMMRRLGSEPWAIGTSHARCLLEGAGRAAHPAPANGCMCGLYGWHAPKPALDACRTTRDLVAGAIIAWGDLQVHAAGFRAQHARPVALAVPAEPSRLRRRPSTPLEPLRRASNPITRRFMTRSGERRCADRMPVLVLPGPAKPIRVEPIRDPEPRREPVEVPGAPERAPARPAEPAEPVPRQATLAGLTGLTGSPAASRRGSWG